MFGSKKKRRSPLALVCCGISNPTTGSSYGFSCSLGWMIHLYNEGESNSRNSTVDKTRIPRRSVLVK